MGGPTKIATCCYCGTRAALVLRGTERHELSCSACGAPLHEMKMLPREKARNRPKAERDYVSAPRAKPPKPMKRKKKKRKSLLSKAFEEAWDIVEDIFD
ncbi:hypothetical protein ACFORG_15640 [Lutimaribacter marinistellae]|uniref:TFIIB zinc-binding n=1 Tax=Lutimaribacter marinistellae TaxID=1820329 RepID=A0ABV7TJY8_9RHOB